MYRIEKLTKRHDRDAFDCGEETLNIYLRRYARQNTTRGISTTYVLVREGEIRVLAYYAISTGQVEREAVPEEHTLPRYPVPTIRIGRLATDLTVQGEGIGRLMLADAVRRAITIAEEIGVYAIEVDAINDNARAFYLRYGFETLLDDRQHLFMPIKQARRHVK